MALVGEVLLLEQAASLPTTTVSGVGSVSSVETFGSATRIRRIIGAIGIATSQAFGAPTRTTPASFTITGVGAIPSPDEYGAGAYGGDLYSTPQFGAVLVRAFGTVTVTGAGGISSGQAFGRPTLVVGVAPPDAPGPLGGVRIGDTGVYAAATSDGLAYAIQVGDFAVYAAATDDALLYTERVSDVLVYAGAEDDIPGH